MEVKIKRLNERAKIPTFGTEFSAGADLYCAEEHEMTVYGGQKCSIGIGISMEIPEGYVGLVFARSGLACKNGLRLCNSVGVIDADYRGEIKVVLHNDSEYVRGIKPGERVAQMIIMPYPKVTFTEVEELSDTVRGESGFGGTGRF